MKTRPLLSLVAIGCVIVALSACVYRMDIPQGNRIDPELIEQLELGMSQNQVEFLLGTPAVIDLYHPNTWYYIFYHKTGETGEVVQRKMTLTFTDNLLSEIDGSVIPTTEELLNPS